MTGTVHLVRGADPSLVGAAVTELVQSLLGAQDHALAVDELDGELTDLGAVVDAARTLPFLTDRRVVVVRKLKFHFPRGAATASVGEGEADEPDEPSAPAGSLAPLLAYLANPEPTTDLVLDASERTTPRALLDAVKKAGGQVVETDLKNANARGAWIDEHIRAAGVRLDAAAKQMLSTHLGEDVARAGPLLEVLASTYGEGARIGPAELAPFLGEAGGVPPWDLTDRIDAGKIQEALQVLDRMVGAGDRHPLQVMAILHGHYVRLARLDGSDARSEADAAALLKVAPFQAKKALQAARQLGPDGIARAFRLLAVADLDLRGKRDLGAGLVLEVLVARLSRLSPTRRAPARR